MSAYGDDTTSFVRRSGCAPDDFVARGRYADYRGALSRNDRKLPDLQHRYAGWFAPHIQRLIDSQHA